MNKNPILSFLGVAFGLFLIALGIAFVVTALHSGGLLLTQTIITLFHISVEVVLAAIILVAIVLAVVFVKEKIERELGKLQHQVKQLAGMVRELAKKLREPARPIVAMCALIVEAVKIVADKSFEGHEEEGLIVSLVLVILFFVANQWLKDEKNKKNQWIGAGIWLGAIALVPIMVMLINGWDLRELWEEIETNLEPGTMVVLGLVLFVLIILPFPFKHLKED
jgi:hypothetical protein